MNMYLRLNFKNNNNDVVRYDFVNTTKENDLIMVNFYRFRDYTRCKKEIKELLLNSMTLKDVLKHFKDMGFYLYLVEKTDPNINYFMIVRNLDRNKLNFPENFTTKYIENNCYNNVNSSEKENNLDLSDLD